MESYKRKLNLKLLQAIVWLIIALLMFLSYLQRDSVIQSLVYTSIIVGTYIFIIYTHSNFLVPRFFKQNKIGLYICLVLLMLLIAIFIRSYVTLQIYNYWFANKVEAFTTNMLISGASSAILIFVVSILFGLALDFFKLREKQSIMKSEKTAAELNLLKQQVHPHFLFNTLNNIYYVAQKQSPEAADLIERLSRIMRYFIEESAKPNVRLLQEIELMRNYIELERIRILHDIHLDFQIKGPVENISLPPLLMMPLVENIFKHGINKRALSNPIKIELHIMQKQLSFRTENNIFSVSPSGYSGGLGITNLKKRLICYYNTNFEFSTTAENGLFISQLFIPIDENNMYHN